MKRGASTTGLAIAVMGIALLLLLLSEGTGHLPSPIFAPKEYAFWDIFIKALAGILGLAGAAITAFKYLDEKSQANDAARSANEAAEQANKTAELEARKPFDQQRQAVYLDLLSTTARIGNTRSGTPERVEASDRFWFIYWGPLPLVSDYAVGQAVNIFSELMDRPDDEVPLRNASMAIARACRESLGYVAPEGIVPVDFAQPRLA